MMQRIRIYLLYTISDFFSLFYINSNIIFKLNEQTDTPNNTKKIIY